MRRFLDITFLKFVVVGVINTLVGSAIMFASYNILHFSYWVSSALNYCLASILSYFLNKNFTFRDTQSSKKTMVRFTTNIIVCYLVAYGVAKPLMRMLLSTASEVIQENVAMLAGMCFFVVINYCGQRFFVFKKQ